MADIQHEAPPDEMPEEMRKYWQPGDVVVRSPMYLAYIGYFINICGKSCYASIYNDGHITVSETGGDLNRLDIPGAYIIPNKHTNPLEVY